MSCFSRQNSKEEEKFLNLKTQKEKSFHFEIKLEIILLFQKKISNNRHIVVVVL
jgi:hypothetical protein